MFEELEYEWFSYKITDSPQPLLCKHCGEYKSQTPIYIETRVLKTPNISISGRPLERADNYMKTRCSGCKGLNMYPLWYWHIDEFENSQLGENNET